jgi:hypothetical protein
MGCIISTSTKIIQVNILQDQFCSPFTVDDGRFVTLQGFVFNRAIIYTKCVQRKMCTRTSGCWRRRDDTPLFIHYWAE